VVQRDPILVPNRSISVAFMGTSQAYEGHWGYLSLGFSLWCYFQRQDLPMRGLDWKKLPVKCLCKGDLLRCCLLNVNIPIRISHSRSKVATWQVQWHVRTFSQTSVLSPYRQKYLVWVNFGEFWQGEDICGVGLLYNFFPLSCPKYWLLPLYWQFHRSTKLGCDKLKLDRYC